MSVSIVKPARPQTETSTLNAIRAELNRLPGVTLMRNNVGMLEDAHGGRVRYGLGDGSADLIGSVTVPAAKPGFTDFPTIIARAFALEVKRPGYKRGKRPTQTELDQDAWAESKRALGWYVATVQSVDEALAAVEAARAL